MLGFFINRKDRKDRKNNSFNLRQELELLEGGMASPQGINDIFNYPKYLSFGDYMAMYKRSQIARRVVKAYPSASWSVRPEITANDKEVSLFSDIQKKTKLFKALQTADTLACLGGYSVLLFGIDDGLSLDEPIVGTEKERTLLYVKAYSQNSATIETFDEDPKSPRYGRPESYKIDAGSYSSSIAKTIIVHHSRVVHVVHDGLENDIYGSSILEPIFNRLLDMDKTVGSASQALFKSSQHPLHIDLDGDGYVSDEQSEQIKKTLSDFVGNKSSYILTQGAKANILGVNMTSPKDTFDAIVSLISGATGMPKRIIIGSEAGKLASNQDANNWRQRIRERRESYCSDTILSPVLDMLMSFGAIPKDDYKITFKDDDGLTDTEKSEIALKKMQALKVYSETEQASYYLTIKDAMDTMGLPYNKEDIQADTQEDEDNNES